MSVYTGVNGQAKKVTKMYVGVDGQAREVVKGYIGVNGMAEPFYSKGGGGLPGELPEITSSSSIMVHAYGMVYGGWTYEEIGKFITREDGSWQTAPGDSQSLPYPVFVEEDENGVPCLTEQTEFDLKVDVSPELLEYLDGNELSVEIEITVRAAALFSQSSENGHALITLRGVIDASGYTQTGITVARDEDAGGEDTGGYTITLIPTGGMTE